VKLTGKVNVLKQEQGWCL